MVWSTHHLVVRRELFRIYVGTSTDFAMLILNHSIAVNAIQMDNVVLRAVNVQQNAWVGNFHVFVAFATEQLLLGILL